MDLPRFNGVARNLSDFGVSLSQAWDFALQKSKTTGDLSLQQKVGNDGKAFKAAVAAGLTPESAADWLARYRAAVAVLEPSSGAWGAALGLIALAVIAPIALIVASRRGRRG